MNILRSLGMIHIRTELFHVGAARGEAGRGSSLATGVSRAVVAGDAQATTHTGSTSAHTRSRARLFSGARPPALRSRCSRPWTRGSVS